MDQFILPKIVNTAGLFFDIIGAWLVAWEVVDQYNGEKYLLKNLPAHRVRSTLNPSAEEHPSFAKHEKNKYTKMKLGLLALTIGFSLQIASNWLYPLDLNNENAKHNNPAATPQSPPKTTAALPYIPPSITTKKEETNSKPAM